MDEKQVDTIIYNALSPPEGKLFHQWLVNNYLMQPKVTTDANQALVSNAIAAFVASINTRFTRHITGEDNAASRETKRVERRSKHRPR